MPAQPHEHRAGRDTFTRRNGFGWRRFAAAGVGLLLAGCATFLPDEVPTPPRIEIAELSLTSADPASPQVRMDLRLHNVTDDPLPLERLTYTLWLNNQPFLEGGRDTRFEIPPDGIEVVTLEPTVLSRPAFRELLAVKEGIVSRLPYRIKGLISIAGDAPSIEFEQRGGLSPNPGKPNSFR